MPAPAPASAPVWQLWHCIFTPAGLVCVAWLNGMVCGISTGNGE